MWTPRIVLALVLLALLNAAGAAYMYLRVTRLTGQAEAEAFDARLKPGEHEKGWLDPRYENFVTTDEPAEIRAEHRKVGVCKADEEFRVREQHTYDELIRRQGGVKGTTEEFDDRVGIQMAVQDMYKEKCPGYEK